MLGKKVTYDYVPYFWTRQWDMSLQYTGYGTEWDEVFIDGNLHEGKFVAYYIKGDNIVAAAAMNAPNAINIIYEGFRHNKLPNAKLIKNGIANVNSIKDSLKGVKNRCSKVDCVCANKQKKSLI